MIVCPNCDDNVEMNQTRKYTWDCSGCGWREHR